MHEYKELVKTILDTGKPHNDRTGVGTLSIFGYQMRINLQDFPCVTVKKTFWKGALRELIFFLNGGNNIADMHPSIKKWWEPFADSNGYLGPATYGNTWRQFGGELDQITSVIDEIKQNPASRRLIVVGYDPYMFHKSHSLNSEKSVWLPPCHGNIIQFKVDDNKLHCSTYQRSSDVFLGLPINLCHYAFLTYMIANVTGLDVGNLIYTIGDAHIYTNHVEQCRELIGRNEFPLPELVIHGKLDETLYNLDENDFQLIGYVHHPALKGEMAV